MKQVRTVVVHCVPQWNYCNHDMLGDNASLTNQRCRFCEKRSDGYRCLLENKKLLSDGTFIHKTAACKRK